MRKRVVRLRKLHKTARESKLWEVISMLIFAVGAFVLMGVIVSLLSVVGWLSGRGGYPYEREDTVFHTLPFAQYKWEESSERIVLADKSSYAENASLALCQYISRFYQDQRLIQEQFYDPQGSRFYLRTLSYDTAGNVLTEQITDEAEGMQTYRHIYEYDDLGRMAHEEIYRDEDLMERNYFRYLDSSHEKERAAYPFDKEMGYACVSYSYLNDQIQGGISQYCANRTEALTDGEDNPLCIVKLNSLLQNHPSEVWKLQWQRKGERMLNRVQHYIYGTLFHDDADNWYLRRPQADEEQLNLYMCPDGAEKNLVLQLNYNYNNSKFLLKNTFYRARYEGGRLLWQVDYAEGGLVYYSACLYDGEGRIQEAVEYDAQGEENRKALFHRYAYPDSDTEEQYTYLIQGEEFSFDFGDGDQVMLHFSENGILSAIEMTNVSENKPETYAFAVSGDNAGQLLQMCVGSKSAEGEREILRELEKEAERFDLYVGEDLEGSAE